MMYYSDTMLLVVVIVLAIVAVGIAVRAAKHVAKLKHRLKGLERELKEAKEERNQASSQVALKRADTNVAREASTNLPSTPTPKHSAPHDAFSEEWRANAHVLPEIGIEPTPILLENGGSEPPMFADVMPRAEAFSRETVREIYTRWCNGQARPLSTSIIDVASLHYDRAHEERDGKRSHLLRDAPQVAEFVRFSPTAQDVGMVLPNPDAHFTPVVAYLFPGIGRADYAQRERLAAQEPVTIKRFSSSQWESM